MKKISCLSTGNELIEGDTQDTNSNFFARNLHDRGAKIYQHLQCSDEQVEIIAALRHLLNASEALIITGGMGPTSDDRTRFAVSEFSGKELIFDEASWKQIEERFKRFNLHLVSSNRQQALFPQGAEIYPNENGSAPGCHLIWEGKHLFLLPGPPKECRPIFEAQVLPTLKKAGFFYPRNTVRWLTLGLSESEIGEKVDELVKPHGLNTGFRWSHPYLEIKLISEEGEPDPAVILQLDKLLEPYCISKNRKDAVETLEEKLKAFGKFIYIQNGITQGFEGHLLQNEHLIYTDKDRGSEQEFFFSVESYPKISSARPEANTITFSSQGMIKGHPKHEHHFSVPCRGPEVINSARAYMAWQLSRFISVCQGQG